MNWQIEENNLDYKTYFALRESVGWSNFSPKQAEIAIANILQLCAKKDNFKIKSFGQIEKIEDSKLKKDSDSIAFQ